ncbi:periplasmic binding protein-like I [Polychytrium aggregatum]|uniref:periplasmic binding protein-like I n=1 Tax=Polychytrium aggregatum TaxID=110093 RepID=UPI0022FEB4E1|nr:periplasmic binding protein-like I [Polychytrium aggregatum]KAI9204242.1 periplasmic binding protein-like I [Polychytrium aggregatum]
MEAHGQPASNLLFTSFLTRRIDIQRLALEPIDIYGSNDQLRIANSTTSAQAMMAGEFNIPYCSPISVDDSFNDKSKYPTLIRTVGTAVPAGATVVDWVLAMGWTKVVLAVTCKINDQYGYLFLQGFLARAQYTGLTILDTIYYYCNASPDFSANDFVTPVQRMKATNGKIIISLGNIGPSSVLYAQSVRKLPFRGKGYLPMIMNSQAGLTTSDYVWFMAGGRWAASDYANFFQTPSNLAASYYPGRAIQSSDLPTDGPVSYWPNNPQWLKFNQTWSTYNQRSLTYAPGGAHVVMPMTYDCTLAMIYAFDNLLRVYPNTVTLSAIAQGGLSRQYTTPAMFSLGQPGSCGPLLFDNEGNFESGGISIQMIRNDNTWNMATITLMGNFSYASTNVKIEQGLTPAAWFQFYYNVTTNVTVPVDYPPIIQTNETFSTAAAPVVIITLLIVALLGVLYFSFTNYRQPAHINITFFRFAVASAIVAYCTYFFFVGIPTNTICTAQTYLLAWVFAMCNGAFLVNSFGQRRVTLCKSSDMIKKAVSSRPMILATTGNVVLSWILCIISDRRDPRVAVNISVSNLHIYTLCKSTSGQGWTTEHTILIIFQGILLIVAIWNTWSFTKSPLLRTQAQLLLLGVAHMLVLTLVFAGLLSSPVMVGYMFVLHSVAFTVIPTAVIGPIIAATILDSLKTNKEAKLASSTMLRSPAREREMLMKKKTIVFTSVSVELTIRNRKIDARHCDISVIDDSVVIQVRQGHQTESLDQDLPAIIQVVGGGIEIVRSTHRITISVGRKEPLVISFANTELATDFQDAVDDYFLSTSRHCDLWRFHRFGRLAEPGILCRFSKFRGLGGVLSLTISISIPWQAMTLPHGPAASNKHQLEPKAAAKHTCIAKHEHF